MTSDRAAVKAVRDRVADALGRRDDRDDGLGDPRLTGEARRVFARDATNIEIDALAASRLAAGRSPLSIDDEEDLASEVLAALFGLGPFERYLAVDDVEDICANGCRNVFLHFADGTKRRVDPVADSDQELVELVRTAAARLGRSERRFDVGHPRLNLRLPDGSRLHAVMEVTDVPCVTIRRHRFQKMTFADLLGLGTVDHAVASLLTAAVRARSNIIVCGGVSAGKTTFLRALLHEVPSDERIIVIEDDAELFLSADVETHPDVVEMERRDPNVEGQGEIDMATLVREALRMRPDRVIVGEVRGAEVVPMLHALNQGNEGSMCTLHADSTRTAFSRLTTYAASAQEAYAPSVTARLVGDAVDFVVHLRRGTDGGRVVTSIREVTGSDGELVTSNEILAPDRDGRARPATPITTGRLGRLTDAGFDAALLAHSFRAAP
jgi:Flp pilus assembly CpaF family ATPase